MEMAAATRRSGEKRQGRKKIEMKLVKKKSNRMVTFSKRRMSIFGKASELSTLCGAQVAIMIFSPGGKLYSFGHPSVEAVMARFESRNWHNGSPDQFSPSPYGADSMRLAYKAEKTRRLKMELEMILQRIESEKRKSRALDLAWDGVCARNHWWNTKIKEMNLPWCKEMKKRLMELKMKVETEAKKKHSSAPIRVVPVSPNYDDQGRIFGSGIGHLMPSSHHPAGVFPRTYVSEWISSYAGSFNNFMPAGLSSAAAATVSPVFNFCGGSGNVAPFPVNPRLAPNQYGAASSRIKFNNSRV
ncbi:unnamed protein product [Rhodiola kirilowii]